MGDGSSHFEGEGDPPRDGQALARLTAWKDAEGICVDIDPAVANRTVAAILAEAWAATAPWSAVADSLTESEGDFTRTLAGYARHLAYTTLGSIAQTYLISLMDDERSQCRG